MKWVSKILINRGTVEGVNKFTLTYSPGSQEIYAEQYSTRTAVANQAPAVQYHEPSEGASVPVLVKDQNKEIFLETAVLGASNNAIIASINALKRAIRAATADNGNVVELAITPDGSAYTTYYKILHGYVDDSRAYYEDTSDTVVKDIVVPLTCGPYGYGDSFTLSNYLPSSPHMIEDSDADGLADGLTKLSTPTCTISTSVWYVGGKSQKVVTTSTNQGIIMSQSASGSIGDTAIAKGKVVIGTGGATVKAELRNGGGTVLQSVTLPTNSVRNETGPDGNLWYEFQISGTATGTGGFQLYVYSASSGVTFYADSLYCEPGTLTQHAGFSSKRSLKNRYDPATAAANINYLDVWGIPGDAPADVIIRYDKNNSAKDGLILAGLADGKTLSTAFPFWLDDTAFSGFAAIFWSQTADAARVGGSYMSCPGGGAIQQSTVRYTFSAAQARALLNTPFRIFAIHYGEYTTAGLYATINSGDASIQGETVTRTVATAWGLSDLGTFNLQGVGAEVATTSMQFRLTAVGTGISRVDSVLFLPVRQGIAFTPYLYTQDDSEIIFNSDTNKVEMQVLDSTGTVDYGYSSIHTFGVVPKLQPKVANRLYFVSYADKSAGDPEEHNIDDAPDITLTVTPRTSHLLGVA